MKRAMKRARQKANQQVSKRKRKFVVDAEAHANLTPSKSSPRKNKKKATYRLKRQARRRLESDKQILELCHGGHCGCSMDCRFGRSEFPACLRRISPGGISKARQELDESESRDKHLQGTVTRGFIAAPAGSLPQYECTVQGKVVCFACWQKVYCIEMQAMDHLNRQLDQELRDTWNSLLHQSEYVCFTPVEPVEANDSDSMPEGLNGLYDVWV